MGGGWESRKNEFPWQVSLQWFGSHICGGSVVDSRHVITAAHCVENDAPSRLSVVVGDHRRNQPGSYKKTVDVIANNWHHRYDLTGNIENDIAVLTLAEDLDFNDGVQPVCAPVTGQDYYVGQTSSVSGWGATRSGGSVTQELRYTNVPIMAYNDCTRAFPNGWVEPGMVCAGNTGGNDRDSCQGDSGGPLVVRNGDSFELVGVVSWGLGCASLTPGVYAEVSYYEDWLDETIN